MGNKGILFTITTEAAVQPASPEGCVFLFIEFTAENSYTVMGKMGNTVYPLLAVLKEETELS